MTETHQMTGLWVVNAHSATVIRWVNTLQVAPKPVSKPCGVMFEELIQKLINTGYALAATHTGSYHTIFLLTKPHFVE